VTKTGKMRYVEKLTGIACTELILSSGLPMSTAAYLPTWITKNLAVGHAPMSYDELESLKEQGITAIVNLCAEFCDLHEIEAKAGFEVF
jgi:hypothetical protein